MFNTSDFSARMCGPQEGIFLCLSQQGRAVPGAEVPPTMNGGSFRATNV